MKVGISTACTAYSAETEDGISLIKNIGADCMEVYLQTFYEYRPEFAKKYAERAKGTAVGSVRVNFRDFEPHLFERSRRLRGDGFYWLDQIMRSARLFGAKNYTFNGFAEECDFDFYAERLRETSEFCSRYGVRLCIENSVNGVYNRPGIFREIKLRYPEISGAFNYNKAVKSGYPHTMYLAEMQGSIADVHIPDIGISEYGLSELFRRLKDTGFDGNVLIDYKGGASETVLKGLLEFLKEIVYKIK